MDVTTGKRPPEVATTPPSGASSESPPNAQAGGAGSTTMPPGLPPGIQEQLNAIAGDGNWTITEVGGGVAPPGEGPGGGQAQLALHPSASVAGQTAGVQDGGHLAPGGRAVRCSFWKHFCLYFHALFSSENDEGTSWR